MDLTTYTERANNRLEGAGFGVERGDGEFALIAHRREVKPSRFGFVDTLVAINGPAALATPEGLRNLAAQVFREAQARKVRLPRGLGSSVVCYPVLAVEIVPAELRDFVADFVPKHWGALDFPVVVDLASETLVCCEKTPPGVLLTTSARALMLATCWRRARTPSARTITASKAAGEACKFSLPLGAKTTAPATGFVPAP